MSVSKEQGTKVVYGGIGLTTILTVAFIILKLCNVIDWPWWLVVLPTLVDIGAPIILFIVYIVGVLIISVVAAIISAIAAIFIEIVDAFDKGKERKRKKDDKN